ncbi:MAG: glycosyltransferase [Nitrospira sp.]
MQVSKGQAVGNVSGIYPNDREESYPRRILMLVPHEPEEDPRVGWVIDLCKEVGRTDVLGFSWLVGARPYRQYDGHVFIERVFPRSNVRKKALGHVLQLLCNPTHTILVSSKCRRLLRLMRMEGIVRPILERRMMSKIRSAHISRPSPENLSRPTLRSITMGALRRAWPSLVSCIDILRGMQVIYRTLYERARAVSIVPRVILCHDIYALLAAVKLKKLMGCAVIYDSHEVWPEAFLEAGMLERRVIAFIERKAIRQADAVITVNPQVARYLERQYGIEHVVAVPNAEPLRKDVEPSSARPVTFPIKILVQGRIVPGRGFEELLNAWALIDDERAVLLLRSPMNEYFQRLCEVHRDLISNERIRIEEAVAEDQLVEAASRADVGVIPYRGPNLNHVYCCPNKLSQYMQAGLAILSTSETQYVSQILSQYKCGLTYDPSSPDGLKEAVKLLINDTTLLCSLKENAHKATHAGFNWACLSLPYRQTIEKFFVEEVSHQCP